MNIQPPLFVRPLYREKKTLFDEHALNLKKLLTAHNIF